MKYQITLLEQVRYRKFLTVEIPDHMSEEKFETVMDIVESRSMTASDVPFIMERYGIKTIDHDGVNDYSSPEDAEIEIEEYGEA